jgi:uncharacterized protein (DUF2141 family)
MNAIFLYLLMMIAGTQSGKIDLKVTFTGITKAQGSLYIRIQNEQEEVVVNRIVLVSGLKMSVTFKDLAAGKYAISVFQDVNNNGKLDIGMFGPKEPYGFSNNVRGILSAPDFESQLFDFEQSTSIQITLK